MTISSTSSDQTVAMESATKGFIEVWNTKEYDKLDGIATADFQRVAPDQNANGLAEMKQLMSQVHTTNPDFSIEIHESAYAENTSFILWTARGTNTGDGDVPASGNSWEVSGITMLRFVGGRISQEVAHYDTATLLNQVGTSELPHVAQ